MFKNSNGTLTKVFIIIVKRKTEEKSLKQTFLQFKLE
ncbi:hypothetical protein SANR_1575 [Streptococcus anginosus C238]|nr:hypothetical protein SANR_1575 [Streptococcus anginosus C238]